MNTPQALQLSNNNITSRPDPGPLPSRDFPDGLSIDPTEKQLLENWKNMSKHLDKIEKALRDRIASAPNGPGFKKPGSMNKKKTGYLGHKAKRKGA